MIEDIDLEQERQEWLLDFNRTEKVKSALELRAYRLLKQL